MSEGLLGSFYTPGSAHIGSFEIGGDPNMRVVPGDFTLKSNLPILGRDPYTQEPYVVAKGTIMTYEDGTYTARPVMDICQSGEVPIGVAPSHMFRQSLPTMEEKQPRPIRQTDIRMPYIAGTNGTVVNGGWLKSGNAGVFVDWVGASDAAELAIGQLIHLSTDWEWDNWLKYVTQGGESGMGWTGSAMFPQTILSVVTRDGSSYAAQASTTATLGITPASSLRANVANTEYYLTKTRVSGAYPIDVVVAGVTLTKDSVSGVWGSGIRDGDGYNYFVDLANHKVIFTSAQATTATVQVTYAYESDLTSGLDWEAGIPGLTDGLISGVGAGLKAFFDRVGVTGIMTIRLF